MLVPTTSSFPHGVRFPKLAYHFPLAVRVEESSVSKAPLSSRVSWSGEGLAPVDLKCIQGYTRVMSIVKCLLSTVSYLADTGHLS